jgi:RHS repeat-associated protein
VVNAGGTVLERYLYSPYGTPTILDADFAPDGDNFSDIDNTHLYTGREYDIYTGLQLNRNRFYAAHLGRWVTRDPIEYDGGLNLYGYVGAMPTSFVDPNGTAGKCFFNRSMEHVGGPNPELKQRLDHIGTMQMGGATYQTYLVTRSWWVALTSISHGCGEPLFVQWNVEFAKKTHWSDNIKTSIGINIPYGVFYANVEYNFGGGGGGGESGVTFNQPATSGPWQKDCYQFTTWLIVEREKKGTMTRETGRQWLGDRWRPYMTESWLFATQFGEGYSGKADTYTCKKQCTPTN